MNNKDGNNIVTQQKNFYVNPYDDIRDDDERLIKQDRSHSEYCNEELNVLKIEFLGEVEGYRVYNAPLKGPNSKLNVLAIKNGKAYNLYKLVHETSISIEKLNEILPNEFRIGDPINRVI